MLTESQLVAGSLLTTSPVIYYTATKQSTVKVINVVNNHTETVDFYVYAVPPGGSAGNANLFLKATLQVGDSPPYFRAKTLPAGYTLQAKATVGAVVAFSVDGYIKS